MWNPVMLVRVSKHGRGNAFLAMTHFNIYDALVLCVRFCVYWFRVGLLLCQCVWSNIVCGA